MSSSIATSSSALEEEFRGEELGPNIDDTALAEAAKRSRLPFDRPTEHELAFFPELWEHRTAVEVFLMIRNTALATWQLNPLRECTVLDVRNNISPPFNSDIDLIQNVVHFLTRHGLINFGRYSRATKITKYLVRNERKVIVIGAGVAGLSAAMQLTSFGFDVTILEARNRMGGRVYGFRTVHGNIVETGGDTFRKLECSPIASLLQQVNIEEHGVLDYTSIFADGKPLHEDRATMFLRHYRAAAGALNYEAHQREHRDENGRWISRQRAFENMMNMCERGTLIKYFNYTKSLEEVARAREHHYNQMKMCHNTAMLAEHKLKRMEEQGLLDNDPVLRRSLKRDVMSSMDRFDEVANAFESTENHWQKLNDHPQAKQFMHPGSDFSTYNFMLGFEEYLIGAQLEKVQFSCDSAANKENGEASRLPQGVHALFRALIERRKTDIRLNHRVLDIDYSRSDKVRVTVKKCSGNVEVMDAALVVSTIPIGVLKKTIANDERAPKFSPPLPDDKVRAIRRMGSGVVNKVILEFERPFWANATSSRANQFVTVSPNIKVRGSLCIWSSIPKSNVLTTYIVGETADHELPDDVIVHNAMTILQKVFGNQCPRTPVSAHITRWQEDEFAFGSGAYMGLNTEMVDFDDLMKPLATMDGKNRVYFAGEHTCSSYTSTIQGAWMSGARVAADIANEHVGVGFVDLTPLDPANEEDPANLEVITIDHDGPMEDGAAEAVDSEIVTAVENVEIPEANGVNGTNGTNADGAPDSKKPKTSEA